MIIVIQHRRYCQSEFRELSDPSMYKIAHGRCSESQRSVSIITEGLDHTGFKRKFDQDRWMEQM